MKRVACLLGVVVALAVGLGMPAPAHAAVSSPPECAPLVGCVAGPAQEGATGRGGFCDNAPLGVVCTVVGGVATVAGGMVGQAATAAIGGVAGWLAHWVGEGFAFALDHVLQAATSTATLPLGGGSPVVRTYAGVGGIAGGVALLALLLCVAWSLIRGDPLLAMRGAARVPMAFAMMSGAVAVVALSVAVVDQLTATVVGNRLHDALASSGASVFGKALFLGGPNGAQMGGAAVALLLLLGCVGALLVWFELVVRTGVIAVALVFLPLALAMWVWPPAAGFARRLTHVLVGAVMSKFVIVVTLWLGYEVLASAMAQDDVGQLVDAVLILWLAVLAPLLVLGIIGLEGVVHHAAIRSEAQRMVRAPVAAAQRVRGLAAGGATSGAAARSVRPRPPV
jgi:hypothetical protein